MNLRVQMQDRYAGDIGDYIKLALLRSLSPGKRLGIAWYRYPDESHNADGRHTAYLSNSAGWRHLDSALFDLLEPLTRSERSVLALHKAFMPETLFAAEPVTNGLPARDRSAARKQWFDRSQEMLGLCDLVFADPDNGLVDDQEWRRRAPGFGKQMPLSEARALSAGRCAVIYHHNSRFKGGHDAEVDSWLRALEMPTIAVRATAYSCRTFFVVNPDADIADRTRAFCEKWKDHKVRLHATRVD